MNKEYVIEKTFLALFQSTWTALLQNELASFKERVLQQ